jgi:N-acetylglucosaminyldiphosphoundecaprenol N-acetyl-beta-D-mannosaminyltransferase
MNTKIKRINLMGCPVDCLNMDQTVLLINQYIKEKRSCQHVVVNAAKFVQMQKDHELNHIISKCEIINADGMPIVWASKMLGSPLPERVAGIDLFMRLIQLCAEKGYRPFFFGAREWVVEKVVSVFKQEYPSLKVAGYRNGYFSKDEEPAIAKMIRDSKADLLFVAFSSPMKERFLEQWIPEMKIPFNMGVGGSFDVVAGKTTRAPKWMQTTGLEWFYRVVQEPRRMWKRYAITNPQFIAMILKEYIRRKKLVR